MDEKILTHIMSYDVDHYWPLIELMVEKSLHYADGKYSINDVKSMLIRKDGQLWLVGDVKTHRICAFAITEILDYPSKRVMLITFAGGFGVDDWIWLIDKLKEYALYFECEAIEIYGRKGWEKKLKNHGYEAIHTILRLDLGAQAHEEDLH